MSKITNFLKNTLANIAGQVLTLMLCIASHCVLG